MGNKLENILPPNLQADLNMRALMAAGDNALDVRQDLDKLLVYDIDNVQEGILAYLAWQFHVDHYDLAETESQKRLMIKQSLPTHRYKGTPWAVEEALKLIYPAATVVDLPNYFKHNGQYKYDEERNYDSTIPITERYYDGTYKYDGERAFGGRRWVEFDVIIDLGEALGLNASKIEQIIRIINENKRRISILNELFWQINILDDTSGGNDVTQIGFGESAAAEAEELTNPFIKPIIRAVGLNNMIEVYWSLESDEANDLNIREIGLLAADNSLISRKTRDAIEKDDSKRFDGVWKLNP